MTDSRKVAAGTFLIAFVALALARAQGPTYGMGRTPTAEELSKVGFATGPDGAGLPAGSGTAAKGSEVYARRCAGCHGAKLEGTKNGPELAGGKGTLLSKDPVRTVGSFWPYAPPIFDYIKRAMPPGGGGTLSNDEAYSLTALVLARNELIAEDAVIDAQSLPKVKMPNRDGFVPARLEDINKQRCRTGTCK
jgi:cytochrome c